jgi:NTP pyrophosphatase (non-canonical NTP hydrolase)
MAINHFGVQHQKNKAIEELGELIVELSREQDRRTDNERVREEIADVIVMAEQLRIIYGASAVDRWIEKKLSRLEGLILGKEDQSDRAI